ncbi:MAG TPA: ABC transporter permease [Vicinamibacterales bacterium]|nr:ABC transporter permease [Vicinamibacterales bacterium]
MRQFLQDLRFGSRALLKTPGFTTVAIVVLALGIGANSAMFSLVNALLLRPLAGKADELVGLYSHDRTKPESSYRGFAYPNFVDIRGSNDVFDALMAHTFAMVGVPSGDTTRQAFIEVVSSNYFDTLGVPLAAGRAFTSEEERPSARIPVVIVRHDRAELLGKTIKINAMDFTVVGVAPAKFTGTMALLSPDMWLPLGMFDVVVNDIFKNNGSGLADRSSLSLVVAGRLKPGVTLAGAAARLDALSRQLEHAYPADNKQQLLTVNPLSRLSTSTSPSSDAGPSGAAAFLMGLSSVVLLIACLNIANMLLARGASRRKEIAIRLAVGGSRARIIRQLLTEGFLLALVGAAGGLLLASWSIAALARSLAAVMPLTLSFEPKPDVMVMAATTAFAVIATVMSGLGPALKLSKTDLVADLKALTADGSPVLGRRFSARNVMVVGQIALSLMLLSAGGLFARGALKAAAANPGFSYEHQLLVATDPTLVQYNETRGRASYREVLARVRALPGVAAVGMAGSVPFGDFHEGHAIERVGGPARQDLAARTETTFRVIGSDYFRALNLPMVRGREFTEAEATSAAAPRVAIVDARLARKLFGADDPLGQMIRYSARPGETTKNDGQPMEIVGVAAPVRDNLFDREAGPAVYEPWGRNYRGNMFLHVRAAQAGTEADLLAAIRREMRNYDPTLPVLQATTMHAFHERSIELWAVQAGGRLFLIFGVLALLLAVVGLYGVKSYIVSQRTREIGIRMALGARPSDVLAMVLREGAALSAAGVALGLPLAALLGFALSSLLYDVKPLDPVVFLAAPALLALAALVATWLPARRATRVTPLTALRAD